MSKTKRTEKAKRRKPLTERISPFQAQIEMGCFTFSEHVQRCSITGKPFDCFDTIYIGRTHIGTYAVTNDAKYIKDVCAVGRHDGDGHEGVCFDLSMSVREADRVIDLIWRPYLAYPEDEGGYTGGW